MTLITRKEKGSKLSIQEMDDNLIHLNNNPMLLGKITANLNLQPITGNPTLQTDCIGINDTLFQVGEQVTITSPSDTVESGPWGTATITSINIYTSGANTLSKCSRDENQYILELVDVSFRIPAPEDMPLSLTVTGDISGADSTVTSITQNNYGPSQPIQLNPNGSLFKINEIILTGINGTPLEGTNCQVRTDIDNDGDQVAFLSGGEGNQIGQPIFRPTGGVESLTVSNQWIGMQLGNDSSENVGGSYNYLVGNTLYFSADAAAGSECTVDVYVFGYTLT